MSETRVATVNGFWVNYSHDSETFSVIWIKTGAEVGYKNTYAAARDFALGCSGDGSGVTWKDVLWTGR